MKSHLCSFTGKEVIGIVVPPLIPVALFALAMHLGASLGALPKPLPALDTDRTILLHQAEATRQPQDASVILLGDSSCLMGVSAVQLGRLLPGAPRVLNLGTLSYLDLDGFGTLLRHYVEANPDRLRTLVLLMHPEALRRASASEYHVEVLQHFYDGQDYCPPNASPVFCALGVEIWRGRVWARAVPQPLGGGYGRRYGFARDLWNHLNANQGSGTDPGQFNAETARGLVELRLANGLEGASGRFRTQVPEGVRLVVGITPMPEGMGGADRPRRVREMLETWGRWLEADAMLAELPPTMPDEFFASSTHLNERGVDEFTRILARALVETGVRRE